MKEKNKVNLFIPMIYNEIKGWYSGHILLVDIF
jgi:hypothetical protein